MPSAMHSLQRTAHKFANRHLTNLHARHAQPPPFTARRPGQESTHRHNAMPPPNFDGGDVHSEETVLFLFLAFGILIVLILILFMLSFQTYLSWRIADTLVDESEGEGSGGKKGLRVWERERKERRRALKALEKRRSVRPRTDEEMELNGASGSSLLFDRTGMKEEVVKEPFWSLKRWF